MQQYKYDFIEFCLGRNVLRFGEFTLKSGRLSPYFFNAGLFSSGRDLAKLGEYYAQAIQASGIAFDVLFGPAYKGIPIATTVAVALANRFNIDKPCCFNRKEAKDHGEGGNLIGSGLFGKVLLVDDVITAGTAIRESMEIIRANQASLAGVFIALNRKEKGKGELSAIQEVERDYGCEVHAIIDFDDLLQFIEASEEYAPYLAKMKAYRERYGVFATGVYAIWYPVVLRQHTKRIVKGLQATGIRKILQIELAVRPDSDQRGMTASGMIVINPPWQLESQMRKILPYLCETLVPEGTGGWKTEWITPE